MRVQFTVSGTEWEKLEAAAAAADYPDVPSYCRDLALGVRNYGLLWKTVVNKIAAMPAGTVFALRDLVDAPPANLGVKLYTHQKELGIEVQKKDSLKTNIFRKL